MNPRNLAVYRFSRPAVSTTHTPLQLYSRRVAGPNICTHYTKFLDTKTPSGGTEGAVSYGFNEVHFAGNSRRCRSYSKFGRHQDGSRRRHLRRKRRRLNYIQCRQCWYCCNNGLMNKKIACFHSRLVPVERSHGRFYKMCPRIAVS